MKKTLFAFALAALAGAQAHAADLLDTVKARGTLRIAMEGTYPPFNFKDPKSGQLTGFDVDVAKIVAAKMGLKPEFVTSEWSAILAGLGAGKYDVIVSQVGIKPEREKAFDFSVPYTYSTPQLIVRKNDNTVYRSLADLKGKRVGVGQGTAYEQQVKTVPGVQIVSYQSTPEYMQDLAFGRIDATFNDSLMVAYMLKNTNLPLKAGARMGAVERSGIPFRKNNPKFKAAIDKAIADAQKDGSLKAASVRWFGVDVTRPAN